MPVNFIIKGPKFRTAHQLVGDGTFPVSQATLLKHARDHGIGRKMGRIIIFSDADVEFTLRGLNMLKLVQRPKSPNWVMRGTVRRRQH